MSREIGMLSRAMAFLFALVSALSFAADAPPAPEPGEHALNAAETAEVLSGIAASFKAHPAVRATIRSEIEDLAGKRTEEGELLLDRGAGEGHPARVLRTFSKPKPKAWLLSGATISEYVPSKKTVYVKDLSAAPKALKQIQAAMTGDIKALDALFSIYVFAKSGSPVLRIVLEKKPGVSKYIHHRIEAQIKPGALFFDKILYVPDEGDELTETFLEIKPVEKLTDANFALPGAEDAERKVETILE